MVARIALFAVLVPVVLTGCAAMAPTGPDVVALPPHGKPLGVFQQEDYECRSYAFNSENAGQTARNSMEDGIAGGAIGTIGGAVAGALIGAAAGNAGVGAAIGAGSGLLVGSTVGANGVQASSANLQARYDAAYSQCMASKGNSIAPPTTVYTTAPTYYTLSPVIYGGAPRFGYWAY